MTNTDEKAPENRSRDTLTPLDSITQLQGNNAAEELRRRLSYMMAFRVLIITLVMGATTFLYWLGDEDLSQPAPFVLYAIIGITYFLTLLYAFVLHRTTQYRDYVRLSLAQLTGDLCIATIIVHVTGGAQSAYTFFYPLAIIGSAIVRHRKGAIVVSVAAANLFLLVAIFGWLSFLPVPQGQRLLPTDLSGLELSRAMALNLVAITGVGALAVQLAAQLQRSSSELEVHRSATADLLTLHEDIVRCLTSGLVTVDAEGLISTINEAAIEILDISSEAQERGLLGRPLAKFAPNLLTLLSTTPLSHLVQRSEFTHGPDNERIIGLSVSPLYDHTHTPVGRILNFQDLTEIRAMEQHLRRTERLTVIGGLAAGVAHEIRNPLASISGSIELLSGNPGSHEDTQALMSIVTREVDRLNTLITELLDYSNPRPMNFVTIDVCDVVRDTLRVFAQDPEFHGVSVSFVGDDGTQTAQVTADPEKIRQLLWNLLRNGAQAAMQGGGHLWVRVETLDLITLSVWDDGPGIEEELLQSVFDPFFTTKAKGSGLGLATVHSIAVDHGGTVRVESTAPSGALFRVQLPYTQQHDG